MSITAIFAVGENAEFGYNGKLPWGSFPQELEAYHSALEEAFTANYNPRVLLVGSNTWKSLPKKAVDRLLGYTTNVWVLSRDGFVNPRGGERLSILTNIGYTLPEEWEYCNVVCIGGAYLLQRLFELHHIEKAYISTVYYDQPVAFSPETLTSFLADRWLKLPEKSITKLLKKTGYKVVSNNVLKFKQELWQF